MAAGTLPATPGRAPAWDAGAAHAPNRARAEVPAAMPAPHRLVVPGRRRAPGCFLSTSYCSFPSPTGPAGTRQAKACDPKAQWTIRCWWMTADSAVLAGAPHAGRSEGISAVCSLVLFASGRCQPAPGRARPALNHLRALLSRPLPSAARSSAGPSQNLLRGAPAHLAGRSGRSLVLDRWPHEDAPLRALGILELFDKDLHPDARHLPGVLQGGGYGAKGLSGELVGESGHRDVVRHPQPEIRDGVVDADSARSRW